MTFNARWSEARRILCIRLDNLGDVLMSTPAIRALRQSFRQACLTLLASRSVTCLARYLPDVDGIIAYDAPWVKHSGNRSTADLELIGRLRRQRFDAAVIFTVFSQSALPAALVCRLAGIPLVLAHVRENPYQLVTDWVRDPDSSPHPRHEVQRQLDLVATVGASCDDKRLVLEPQEADWHTLANLLAHHDVNVENGWIVVHCGASAPSRRYDPALFARVISLLHKTGLQVVLTGSHSEQELVAAVLAQCMPRSHVVDLAGQLHLGQLASLIQHARLLVSNNTGPVHIAAAVQTPVVDLYALTNPQHGPWQVPHRMLFHDVPCRNCYRSICPQGTNACLNMVEPAEVVAAARDLLREHAQPMTVNKVA